jgi:hypothetical protein
MITSTITKATVAAREVGAAPTAAESLVEIKIDYKGSPGNTLKKLSSVVTGMHNNPNFPKSDPTFEALQASKSRLSDALESSKKFRNPLSKQETAEAQLQAIALLDAAAEYVTMTCGPNVLMAETSGYTLKKTTRVRVTAAPVKAVINEIMMGDHPNCVDFNINALGSTAIYLLEMSIDGQKTWTKVDAFTNSNKLCADGLEEGVVYWFRVSGKTTGGYGPVSDAKKWVGQ